MAPNPCEASTRLGRNRSNTGRPSAPTAPPRRTSSRIASPGSPTRSFSPAPSDPLTLPARLAQARRVSLPPTLAALAAQQCGVFTRRQAVAAGCTEREIKTRTGARGDWATVRRGVYTPRSSWDHAGPAARYVLRVHAAVLAAHTPVLPSHASAAALLGMPVRPRWMDLVHVTRPGVGGGRVEGGVSHHVAAYDERDVTLVGDVAVLGMARTAVDIGRAHTLEDAVVAVDAALRLGTTREELWAVADRMWSWAGITTARTAITIGDGGAANPGESLFRLAALEADIGPVETQYHLSDGRREAWTDLRAGRLLMEFDGEVKYLGRDSGGVADRPAHEIVVEEKRREDWCRSQDGGFGMFRAIWPEVLGRRRSETARRMRAAYFQAERLYGAGGRAA